jgi:hypothetical protein
MKLFEVNARKKSKGKLNDLQRAQLQDCLKAGMTVKVGQVSDSLKKDCLDTPLFEPLKEKNQTKLF